MILGAFKRKGKIQSDLMVGLFAIALFVIAGWLLWKLGAWQQPESYPLKARFENAMGIKPETTIYMSGIKIGWVDEIKLDLQTRKAVLHLAIFKAYEIPIDSIARIRSEGVLGASILEIVPGLPDSPILREGQFIRRVEKPTDLEELLEQLGNVASDLQQTTSTLAKVFGSDEGEMSMAAILNNIENLTGRLDELVADNKENFDNITDSLDTAAQSLAADIPVITTNIKTLVANLDGLVEENRGEVGDAIDRIRNATVSLEKALEQVAEISEKINDGKGTVGRLINEDDTIDSLDSALAGVNKFLNKAEKVKTYISYRGEYLTRSGEFKNFIGITIRPNPQKFYLIELVSDPLGRREEVVTYTETENSAGTDFLPGENTQTERTLTYERDKFLISLQLGYRVWDLTFRGGLMQNFGGLGFDYHLWDDRLKLTVEAYDFSRPDNNPVVRALATIRFFDYLFVTAGANDILYDPINDEETLAEFFVGAGLHFEDEDIKYLLTSGGLPMDF